MPETKPSAGVYVRVSTTEQTTETQESELIRYAERRGWKVFKVYADKGQSGARKSRAALDTLEHFHLLCSVSGAKKEAFAIGAGNGLKGGFGRPQQVRFRTRSAAAQSLFDLAPHRPDGVEVRRIRRQVQ